MGSQKEIHTQVQLVQHLETKAYTTTQTPTNGIDRQGFEGIEFIIGIGVITSADASPEKGWTFEMQESDAQASGFTAVTDANAVVHSSANALVTDPDSNGKFLSVYNPADDQAFYRIAYKGLKRYARIIATAVNTPGSTPLGIAALLVVPAHAPTAD